MTDALKTALSKETLASMVDDLEQSYEFTKNELELEVQRYQDELEFMHEDHQRGIQKLNKESEEAVAMLTDTYRKNTEQIKEQHESDKLKYVLEVIHNIEDLLAEEMKTELAMFGVKGFNTAEVLRTSKNNSDLECPTYKTLLHFMESMDQMLINRNITNNCSGRTLNQVREFMSK